MLGKFIRDDVERTSFDQKSATAPQNKLLGFSSQKEKPYNNSVLEEKSRGNEIIDKEEIRLWLKELGLNSYIRKFAEQNPCLNPIKNGVLLTSLLSRLHYARIPINKTPKNVEECKKNIDLIYNSLKKLRISLPYEFLSKLSTEALFSKEEIFYLLLHYLKSLNNRSNYAMNTNTSARYSTRSLFNNNSPLQRSLSHQESSKLLIKSKDEVGSLEEKLFRWLQEKGVIFSLGISPPPEDFNDIFPWITNGLLLCELTEKITGIALIGINRKPLYEKAKKSNIEKAIDVLKDKGLISRQGHCLATEEIFNGNYIFCLELVNVLYQHDQECRQDKENRQNNLVMKRGNSNLLDICQKMKEENKKTSFSIKKTQIKEESYHLNPTILNTTKTISLPKEENKEVKNLISWLNKLGFNRIGEILNEEKNIWNEFQDG